MGPPSPLSAFSDLCSICGRSSVGQIIFLSSFCCCFSLEKRTNNFIISIFNSSKYLPLRLIFNDNKMNSNSRNRNKQKSSSYCGTSSIYVCSILLFFLWISALLYYHWNQKSRCDNSFILSSEQKNYKYTILVGLA